VLFPTVGVKTKSPLEICEACVLLPTRQYYDTHLAIIPVFRINAYRPNMQHRRVSPIFSSKTPMPVQTILPVSLVRTPKHTQTPSSYLYAEIKLLQAPFSQVIPYSYQSIRILPLLVVAR
jgi:hypothetical protein